MAQALGLNVANREHKAKINGLLKIWLDSGALVRREMVANEKGKTVPVVEVGEWVKLEN